MAIEARKPPVLDTTGYAEDRQIEVGFWQRRFAPVFDYREHRLHSG